jgi:O-antigen/teichoic acid export membrane protein/SAM-dependent methyltransferase
MANSSAMLGGNRQLISLVVTYATSTMSMTASVLAQFFVFVVLSRHLGVTEFAIFVTILAAFNIAATLCGLGGREAIIRRVNRDPASYAGILGHNIVLIVATAIPLAAVAVFGLAVLRPDVFDHGGAMPVIAIALSNIFLASIVLITESVFLAKRMFAKANMVNTGFAVARAATAFVACSVFGVNTLADWAVWYTAIHLIAVLTCVAALWPFGRPVLSVQRAEVTLGVHLATPWFLSSILQNVAILALGAVTSPDVVASYSIASRVIYSAFTVITSLSRIIYPGLAGAGREGARAILPATLRYATAATIIATGTSVALFFAAPLLPVLFGPDYAIAMPALKVLCWLLPIWAIDIAGQDALAAIEQHRIRALAFNTTYIAGIAAIVWLTLQFGLVGTYFGDFASQVLTAVAIWTAVVMLVSRDKEQSMDAKLESTIKTLYWQRDVVGRYRDLVAKGLFPQERICLDRLPADCTGSVLDIGIGGGRTTPDLMHRFARYVGIDYSDKMVEESRRAFPGVDFRVMDARALPFSEEFDCAVFSFNGIDTVSFADRQVVLTAIHAALKPGGFLIYSTHNLDFPRVGAWMGKFLVGEMKAPPREFAMSLYNRARNFRLQYRAADGSHAWVSLPHDHCGMQNVFVDIPSELNRLAAMGFKPEIVIGDTKSAPGYDEKDLFVHIMVRKNAEAAEVGRG